MWRPGPETSTCCSRRKEFMRTSFLLFLAPLVLSAQNQAPAAAQTTATLPPVNRFEGSTKFQAKNGQSHDVRVTIHQWTVLPKQKVDSLAEHGFLLVTVRSG